MLPSIATSTLLVVDVQDRLMPAMHQPDQASLIKSIRILLEAFKEFGGNAILSEQYPKGLGHTIAAIQECAEALPTIEKMYFSLCRAAGFSAVESEVRQDVILVGIEAHVCVLQTALDLLAAGKNVWVPLDAVTSRLPSTRDNGLALIERAGGCVINTESLVFNELESAGSDTFKRFSKMIR